MNPKAITLDCAGTLVHVDWKLDQFAVQCAAEIGLTLPVEAGSLYLHLYSRRIGEFWEVNQSRDPEQGKRFWVNLGRAWLSALGQPANLAEQLQEAADRLAFGPDSTIFKLYEDAVPCLSAIRAGGIKMAVISNWDYSLHRVLELLGIREYFDVVIASLEEGVEKPDPELFRVTLERLGAIPGETLHVGDHPIDDLQGAKNAGLQALLLDRDRGVNQPPYLASLTDLPRVLKWID